MAFIVSSHRCPGPKMSSAITILEDLALNTKLQRNVRSCGNPQATILCIENCYSCPQFLAFKNRFVSLRHKASCVLCVLPLQPAAACHASGIPKFCFPFSTCCGSCFQRLLVKYVNHLSTHCAIPSEHKNGFRVKCCFISFSYLCLLNFTDN